MPDDIAAKVTPFHPRGYLARGLPERQPAPRFPSFPFGAEARRRHDEPDMIGIRERRHLGIVEAGGARRLGGRL